MKDSVGVVIATYGELKWYELGKIRALPSVYAQTVSVDKVLQSHSGESSPARARNEGAVLIDTDWIIFLDADDTLDPKYIESMKAGYGDIRYPQVRYIETDGTEGPIQTLHMQSLLHGNFVVVGSMIKRKKFLESGGFDETLPYWEDWELFLKLWVQGERLQLVPDAVYNVFRNPDGRNQLTIPDPMDVFEKIRNRHLAKAIERGLYPA